MNLSNQVNPDIDAGFITTEAASGTYQFKVQYSQTKNIPFNDCISTPIFKVNGHDCKILYFPQGCSVLGEEISVGKEKHIGLTLAMHCRSQEVIASFTLGLLDKYGWPSSMSCKRTEVMTFRPNQWEDSGGFPHFMERSVLETHFVRDGCFTLVCSVTILEDSYKEVPKRFLNGIMPFSIDEHFVKLLQQKETADVSFEVDGEIFTAHRCILAARSPVFSAELFGPMAESKMEIITIKDIVPAVFKAMLHFIYTDSLPDLSEENIPLVAMTQLLFIAADRYALDGLKILCNDRLLRDISLDTAIGILAFAEEQDLEELKDMCLFFVCDPGNLVLLSVTDDYVQLMLRCPSLLKQIGNRLRCHLVNAKPFPTPQVLTN